MAETDIDMLADLAERAGLDDNSLVRSSGPVRTYVDEAILAEKVTIPKITFDPDSQTSGDGPELRPVARAMGEAIREIGEHLFSDYLASLQGQKYMITKLPVTLTQEDRTDVVKWLEWNIPLPLNATHRWGVVSLDGREDSLSVRIVRKRRSK